jgi:hypothetical protein
MTAQTETATRPHQTVELGRYETDIGEQRVLTGRRGGDGVVRIYDVPVDPAGRMYLVEEGIDGWRELAMLRRDYLEQAERLGECPMSPRALRRLVEIQRRQEALS